MKMHRTIITFLFVAALFAGCNVANENISFKPGDSLAIIGDEVVNTQDTASYHVRGFTIDKNYTWTVNGSEVESYREGEFIDIIFPEDQPGDYTITVSTGEHSGELVVDARGDVVQEASLEGYNELVAAIEQAGLTQALKSDTVTVLAPTDSAFIAALDANGNGQIEDTEYPLNLSDILQYHVIPDELPSGDITDSLQVTTLEGSDVQFFIDAEGNIKVNTANILRPDIPAKNGLLHAIDTVLMPPTP